MNRRGGIAHEQEIMQFLFERSGCADYGLFSRAVHALNLLAERSFLFYDQLLNVKRETWAASAQQQQQALSVLADAKTLIQDGVPLKGLARAIAKCHFGKWEEIAPPTIERVLFWQQ
jgi:hypothetical protein